MGHLQALPQLLQLLLRLPLLILYAQLSIALCFACVLAECSAVAPAADYSIASFSAAWQT